MPTGLQMEEQEPLKKCIKCRNKYFVLIKIKGCQYWRPFIYFRSKLSRIFLVKRVADIK
jgi:hypothetical protein